MMTRCIENSTTSGKPISPNGATTYDNTEVVRMYLSNHFSVSSMYGFDIIENCHNAIVVRIVDSDFTLYTNKALATYVRQLLRPKGFHSICVILFGIAGCFNKSNKMLSGVYEHRVRGLRKNIEFHTVFPPAFGVMVNRLFIR